MKNGTGKTVFAKMLDGLAYKKIRLRAENLFCRAFYINSVYSHSKLTFIQGLTDALRRADNGETLRGDIPTVEADAADAKAQIANLINELFAAHKKLFGREKLLLIIDAVDELPNTGTTSKPTPVRAYPSNTFRRSPRRDKTAQQKTVRSRLIRTCSVHRKPRESKRKSSIHNSSPL